MAAARMTVHAMRRDGGLMEISIWRPTRHTWGARVMVDGVHVTNMVRTSLARLIEAIRWWM